MTSISETARRLTDRVSGHLPSAITTESSISSLKAEIGRLKSQLKGINVSANSNAEEHPTHDILMADDEPLEESTNTSPAESNDFVQDNCYSDSEEDAYYSHMAAAEYDYEYSADITDLAEMEQDMQTVTEEPETEEQSEEDIVSLEDMLSIEFQHIQQEEEKKRKKEEQKASSQRSDSEEPKKSFLKSILLLIGTFAAIAFIIFGLISCFSPKVRNVTIDDFEWQRTID